MQFIIFRYTIIYISTLLILLSLIGTRLFDYSLWIIIIPLIFFIDLKKLKDISFVILSLMIISIYIIWYHLDPSIIYNFRFLHGILIIVIYAVSLSIPLNNISKNNLSLIITLIIFMTIFSYILSIMYSYFFIHQDKILNSWGMHVCFENEYHRLHINKGRLISTVIAYFLTFSVIFASIVLIGYRSIVRQNYLGYILIAIAVIFGLFSLYVADLMGRRTVLILFLLTWIYFILKIVIKLFISALKQKNYLQIISAILIILIGIVMAYYLNIDSPAMKRILSGNIFNDHRFSYWFPGIKAMIQYPLGGGHSIFVAKGMKLAHNTWIDIGKDFGVIPFIFSITWFLMQIYYIIILIKLKNIELYIKEMVIIFSVAIFAILSIEPVFTSDKIFFAFVVFFFGIVKNLINFNLNIKYN